MFFDKIKNSLTPSMRPNSDINVDDLDIPPSAYSIGPLERTLIRIKINSDPSIASKIINAVNHAVYHHRTLKCLKYFLKISRIKNGMWI